MRFSRVLAVIGLALSLLALTPSASFACSCPGLTTAEQVEAADVVVRGTVDSRRPPATGVRRSADPVTWSVTVAEVFKGTTDAAMQVRSASSGDSCGLEGIRLGEEYVVFAIEDSRPTGDGLLWANLCGGTAPTTPGLVRQVDAAAAGPVTAPVDVPATAPPDVPGTRDVTPGGDRTESTAGSADLRDDGPVWPWVTGLLGLGLAAGTLAVVVARRRARR
jgi:hypothetical protein